MSSFSRDLELVKSGTAWRHWEMEHFDASTRAAAPADREPADSEPQVSSSKPQPSGDDAAAKPSMAQELEQARLEAKAAGYKEGYEQARKEGYESGLASGRKAAARELEVTRQEIIAPLKAMADAYGAALETLSAETTGELVELALVIGQSMARDCIEVDPRPMEKAIRAILDGDFVPAARPQLLMNPVDLESLSGALGDELGSLGWQLVPDEKVTRGGCLVKNDLSQVDATWESRWRTLSSRVRRRHANETTDETAEAPATVKAKEPEGAQA